MPLNRRKDYCLIITAFYINMYFYSQKLNFINVEKFYLI